MGGSGLVRLLLDTHIWIWSLLEPGRLTTKVAGALRSPRNELWLSPMSVWEFLILVERGRVALDMDVDTWLTEAARHAPMIEAPVTTEIARASRVVDIEHKDPVDRFLAATATVLDLTLVTGDQRLTASKGVSVLPNR
jgi:PIN domain nuclease of toxin-antitoxin system